MHFVYPVLALILMGIVAWIVNTRMPEAERLKATMSVVMTLIVVGIGLWLINTYIPMAGSIKAILNLVVVIATCVFVLKAFGLWSEIVKLWTDLTERLHPR